jgi:hypothetical protein
MLPDNDAGDFVAERLDPAGVFPHGVIDRLNVGMRNASVGRGEARGGAGDALANDRRGRVFCRVEVGVGPSGLKRGGLAA